MCWKDVGWLVVWLFWVERPFETVFQSISGHLPEREKDREKIDERKNVQTSPTRTYCKRNRPLPCYVLEGSKKYMHFSAGPEKTVRPDIK